MAGLSYIGGGTAKGAPLLKLLASRSTYGALVLTPAEHAELRARLDRDYPMAGGEKHNGEYLFGVPVMVAKGAL